MEKYINKNRIVDILLTALISACIAVLQNILVNMTGGGQAHADPSTAMLLGGSIRTALYYRYV